MQRRWPAGPGPDGPREHVRRGRAVHGVHARRRQAAGRLRGVHRPALDDGAPQQEGRQRLQPPHPDRAQRDGLPEPVEADLRGIRQRNALPAAHRHGAAQQARRGDLVPLRLPGWPDQPAVPARQAAGGRGHGDPPARPLRPGPLLAGAAAQRHRHPGQGQRVPGPPQPAHGDPAGRDQRHPLPATRGLPGPGRPALHQHGRQEGRREALPVRDRHALLQDARGDGPHVPRPAGLRHRDHGRR